MRVLVVTISIIYICSASCFSAQLRKIKTYSPSMNRTFTTLAILPQSYDSTTCRFPVIYLLHGYDGNPKQWLKVAPLRKFADTFNVIFICPSVDGASWYLDSPIMKNSKFETFIAIELPKAIDSLFRTIPACSTRCLIGSSMGGHGALCIVAKYTDQFFGAGAISAIMDLSRFPSSFGISKILGPYENNKALWEYNSFMYLVRNLQDKKKKLLIYCGEQDSIALADNRIVHQKLKEFGIDHIYKETPGQHSRQYVGKVFKEIVATMSTAMQQTNNP